ncbi:MAG: DUF3159 domain-containing protein [Clavibacter sp.]|uniref:Integral membrane protein n=1 Tax=Clavibacter sepedonicus TaxID=31964 RepID=B0RC24_CLASE|nr:DUF3159 domain-containing protein [Clavibacter sp.]OQJ47427.1 hypothetical protein B5P19_03400 [Clavibacter sepedonicus]OQJ52983.1 hypothetical protein B5P20_01660 [Clavibacter sepedonicus]CAQ01752.1 putative integral membrane protein [Clavibacter sepedonicus]
MSGEDPRERDPRGQPPPADEAAATDGIPGEPASVSASAPGEALGASMAQAAERAGLGQAARGETMTAAALLTAMGGVRGVLEAIVPGLLFLVAFTLTRDIVLSVAVPVTVAVVAVVARLVQRSAFAPAVGGLVGIVISAVLALRSGEGRDFYALGLWTNGAYFAVLLVSVVVGWPLVGVAVGFLMGDGTAWRQDRRKARALRLLTLVWVGFFALRLAVQLPLYLADSIDALGVARLVMGTPLYGVLLVLSWLFVRAVYAKEPAAPAAG